MSVERVQLRLVLLDLVAEAQNLVLCGQLGVKYAYCIHELNANRQRLASRYFSQVDSPKLREFRELCAGLLAEQAQGDLFDVVTFMSGVEVAAHPPGARDLGGWGPSRPLCVTSKYL